jgi:hypothetical protein
MYGGSAKQLGISKLCTGSEGAGMEAMYQPLRVPSGWLINWNALLELDPTEENVRAGYFGGSSLFSATHEHTRLGVDVEWRPQDDPHGQFKLRVQYAPLERTEKGRRRGVPQVIYEFNTRLRAELVRELEAALRGRHS